MHCCCFEWFGFFFSPLLLRVVLNWIEDFMNALSTASLWTGRQCCSEGVVRRWRLSGGGVIVMGWRGWMCGCVRFTPQRLFFKTFFIIWFYFFFPGHRLRTLKVAQNSLIHLLEAAIHLLENEACGRGERSGHGGKLALQIYVLSQRTG